MWGIVPAAGRGSRIQPLAFSKELLPVGSRLDRSTERPCAVSEYLVERMIRGGARKLCFVVAPGKWDIMQYYGAGYGEASIAYVIQPDAGGLCDAVFRAAPLVRPEEPVVVGLPDTVWFPETALAGLPDDAFSFLLFPVERPSLFDAVLLDGKDRVLRIEVKATTPSTPWVWGAFKLPGRILDELHALWLARDRRDEYIGTLVNAWIAGGGEAIGFKAGRSYVDVGTLGGYREAIALLDRVGSQDAGPGARVALGRPAGHNACRRDGAPHG